MIPPRGVHGKGPQEGVFVNTVKTRDPLLSLAWHLWLLAMAEHMTHGRLVMAGLSPFNFPAG